MRSFSWRNALTNLKVFKAKACERFTDNNIQPFARLSALETLHLSFLDRKEFTDLGLQTLGYLTRLRDLKLGDLMNKTTSTGLDFIFQLIHLERLSLNWGGGEETPNLTNISRLISLKSLSLVWVWPPELPQGIEMVSRLTLLQELKIKHRKVSKEHLSILLPSLTNLTSLDLGICEVFEDNSLAEFLQLDPLPKLMYVGWHNASRPKKTPFLLPVIGYDGFTIGYRRGRYNTGLSDHD